jgi:pimeloyl-ACP methyl ester carboxylesterase
MATYVRVHGGGHGGWCFQRVARLLQAEGHVVYTPTMTGLGERAHLLNAEVDLHRHIEDIAAVLAYEDLRDVILVGHSYGGMVITGAADRVPERVGRRVFLDAANPVNGQSLADIAGPVIKAVRPFGDVRDGMELVLLPAPDAGLLYGVTDPDDLAWMAERLTATPGSASSSPSTSPTRTRCGPFRRTTSSAPRRWPPATKPSWTGLAPRAGSGISTPATTS